MMCNAHDRRKEPQVVAAVLVDADDDGPVVCYSARTVTRSLTGSTAMYRIIFVVAIDLPEAGDQMDVPDDLRRSDPVAEVVDFWRVPLELQVADAPTERAQRAEHSPAGDVPYVLAVPSEGRFP
jgi:hypothetical protein